MGAEDAALVEQSVELHIRGWPTSLSQRPLCTSIVLRLDGTQPPHHLDGRREWFSDQVLREQATQRNLVHALRKRRKKVRTSSTSTSGCSIAAKCPPWSSRRC